MLIFSISYDQKHSVTAESGSFQCPLLRSVPFQAERKRHISILFSTTLDQLEIESALAALNQGGLNAVSAYMQKLDHLLGGSHYLLDEQGVDIVSGANHEELLPRPPASKSRERGRNHMVITHPSTYVRYWVVAVMPDRIRPLGVLPLLPFGRRCHYPAMLVGYCWIAFPYPRDIENRGVIWARRIRGTGHDSKTG